MADAVYAIPNFLGGEISAFAQGRFDKPDYRTSLNVCLNAFPIEIGAWTRRPGTRFAATTRRGFPGRVMKFDFEQSNAITLEFTDGYLRFRSGFLLLQDPAVALVTISSAAQAVAESAVPHGLSNDEAVYIGVAPAVLQARKMLVAVVDSTHVALRDEITGDAIDGATLGTLPAGMTIARVVELATPYFGGSWANIRAVQAEKTDILLNPAVAPQALTVAMPVASAPSFALARALFNDGPYLDPFTNGVLATPDKKSGVIAITLAFPAYSATKAYAAGSFVTYSSVNYVSLVDQNAGNQPDTHASQWAPTSAMSAINDGRGFLGTDAGRLIRLFSEPPAWAVDSTYLASTAAAPVIVSYNPSGLDGETTYWSSLVADNHGHPPGADLLNWEIIPQGAAIWTWGRITTGFSTLIDRSLAGSASIGNMTGGGGLAAAFDGVFSQAASASTEAIVSGSSAAPITLSSFVGKNYAAAADQKIQQATIYPSSDAGFAFGSNIVISLIMLNLRGSATDPGTDASAGTLLGSSGVIANSLSAVTVLSADQATAWKYVWIEHITIATPVASGGLPGPISYSLSNAISELSLFNPPGTGVGTGISVEILGPPLLYTTPITTWRLGLYSDTTGWPTCGTYDDGRLYLGGVIKNRFDASMSNGVDGATVNFAPTNQYGALATNSAITYKLNAKDANQIVGMVAEEGGIVMLTQAGEWLVRAPTTGPIAWNNISARRVTKVGAANIEPVRTEHTNIFVHRYQRKLTEFFPDAYSGKFTGPNLADKAEHLVSSGIAEIAYTSAVTPIIWGRCTDGSLVGVTYKRDTLTTAQPPTFYAWHGHELGSGHIIHSMCGGPSVGGDLDTLTMVTSDPPGGVRRVEVLTDTPDENSGLVDAWYLDSATVPTEMVADLTGVTLRGLWHMNGNSPVVFAGGLDCGDFLVTDGSCFVPFGDGISSGPGRGLFTADFIQSIERTQIVVGFGYRSDGQLVRPIAPADTGARNGPALGKTRRNHQYSMLLANTLGISVGSTFDKLRPVKLRTAGGNDIPPLTMFSGVIHDTLDDDYSLDGMVCWRISRPWPANVVAFSGSIQTQDR